MEKLLQARHGTNLDDCADEQRLRAAFQGGDTAEGFVDGIANKYDLDRIKQAGGNTPEEHE